MPQSDIVNRRVVLAARPRGLPTPRDFRLEETVVPTPREGQVLLRTLYLSLDPGMRNLMDEVEPVYARSVRLDETMVGGTVNRVVASKPTSLCSSMDTIHSSSKAVASQMDCPGVGADRRPQPTTVRQGCAGDTWEKFLLWESSPR